VSEARFVTFIGGPLDGRTQLMTMPFPQRVSIEPSGNQEGQFFYLPNQPWHEWTLHREPKPAKVVYELEGLNCYRAVES